MSEFFYLPLLSLKGLRACLNCAFLKTFQQFLAEGCDNCEKYLKLKNNPERIVLCTSLDFEAIVGITDKFIDRTHGIRNVEKFQTGPYALYVFGRLPESVKKEIEDYCSEENMSPHNSTFLSNTTHNTSVSSLSP